MYFFGWSLLAQYNELQTENIHKNKGKEGVIKISLRDKYTNQEGIKSILWLLLY